ncbi:UDP-N-acetylmuramate:L-alanyl-gamma-D-glutamyl-meso-diaminopimelate ligase [Pelagibaculum spongiae]|uniref:UDP-N-acetylmuramate--L-alanyl-gamma-D-glutamyl-meso-2,6-diaminoheptandioate ligase n=1 Tax=Pelagibaculum spongiae TaxID=2080658 RepID=A0A2V1GWK6_9GAMM|nr:UDP-N-acetylmuramate:L-alanyl-gamma-D-glutamyl-meso-diaminopimelate ligase [Pelagibaculum spongiae]PVZ65470.1 UDP-N-acetylmuramate:L-alanyl-gamma-D-glutamyl-meso-diaminopimelate ligase [Pelagibaculum spongiae]
MRIHILGICGTFMGGLAVLAKQLGHEVSGSDAGVWPPMSTMLESQGIELMSGYKPEHLDPEPDLVIIGNALSRGNPAVEYVLERGIRYISGPQWLSETVLQKRWVLAVAGTHGKTTTSGMLSWLLEDAGFNPGYLIGGVPGNFDVSARLGESDFFVIEADEYDSAFFDKRSKFVHYLPRTLILNNLEFDHADIFPDLAAIERQFQHLLRIVPSTGRVIVAAEKKAGGPALTRVLEAGCWSEVEYFGSDSSQWRAELMQADGSQFKVWCDGELVGEVSWQQFGRHNVQNGLAALAAARHIGIRPQQAIQSLASFKAPKRRMELRGTIRQIEVYDDFAHHPSAIETTIDGLKQRLNSRAKTNGNKVGRLLAVLEPRSNTMRLGVHKNTLAGSLQQADAVFLFQPDNINWSLQDNMSDLASVEVSEKVDELVKKVCQLAQPGDAILVMSNGGFGGIHQKLLDGLSQVITI